MLSRGLSGRELQTLCNTRVRSEASARACMPLSMCVHATSCACMPLSMCVHVCERIQSLGEGLDPTERAKHSPTYPRSQGLDPPVCVCAPPAYSSLTWWTVTLLTEKPRRDFSESKTLLFFEFRVPTVSQQRRSLFRSIQSITFRGMHLVVWSSSRKKLYAHTHQWSVLRVVALYVFSVVCTVFCVYSADGVISVVFCV